MRTVLICIDLQVHSIHIAREARKLLGNDDLVIHLLTVLPEVSVSPHVSGNQGQHELGKTLSHGQVEFKVVADEVSHWGVPCERIQKKGDPVEHIVSTAKEIEADILVMGIKSHSALHHLISGSVSGEVMDKLKTTPVLLVPVTSHS